MSVGQALSLSAPHSQWGVPSPPPNPNTPTRNNPLPGIQFVPVFTAAVVKEGKELQASMRLIAFLASEQATSAIEKTGMKRPAPQER